MILRGQEERRGVLGEVKGDEGGRRGWKRGEEEGRKRKR